jgi:hypothetical protein
MARAGGTAGGGMGGGPDSAPGGSSSKGPGTDGPGNAPGQGMVRIILKTLLYLLTTKEGLVTEKEP